jgi:hypothetical protein
VNISIFEELQRKEFISGNTLDRIKKAEGSRLFSIYWEVKTILYLGVLLLASGLGILIYKNIDTIGHQVVLILIGLICIGCFFYVERKKLQFSRNKVLAPNSYSDYILLLGCLTLITFITYLQVQYTAFGNAYGSATFIPMVILFFCAYYFDHLGVLSLAITNLAAWMGIVVTPMKILKSNNFADAQIIFAGLLLGVLLVLAARATDRKHIKKHFSFTYLNFGMNILFISTLAGMFRFESIYLAWLLPLGILAYYFYKKAIALSSFYFILMIVIYSYIGAGYAAVRLFENYTIALLYLIGSGIYTVLLLIKLNKKLKAQ